MPIDKIAIYWHIFLPFWQLGEVFQLYIDAKRALMILLIEITLRNYSILLFSSILASFDLHMENIVQNHLHL